MANSRQCWLDGSYKIIFADQVNAIANVSGEEVILDTLTDDTDIEKYKRTWKGGNFGPADETISKSSGKTTYNVRMIDPARPDQDSFGVVSDNGKSIACKLHHGPPFSLEWIDETEVKKIKADAEKGMDSADAPQNHYTLRPGQLGKLIWISGAPGFGKSTTARRMMETKGFVYYEGDCYMSHKNPYLPLDNDTAIDALIRARLLKGVSKERRKIVDDSYQEWMKVMDGNEDYDLSPFYASMCDNILQERERVGGDWVVAQAVPSKKLRDLIRSKLGPTLLFVVLNLDKDHQEERLKPRHEKFGGDLPKKWSNMKYEIKEEGEENTLDLKVTREMPLDDVVETIMRNL